MCQLFFGTGEQSAMGEMQLRGAVQEMSGQVVYYWGLVSIALLCIC